jgi:hypothetical protein
MELGSIAKISEILLPEARATRNSVLRSLCSRFCDEWKGGLLKDCSASESDQEGKHLVTGGLKTELGFGEEAEFFSGSIDAETHAQWQGEGGLVAKDCAWRELPVKKEVGEELERGRGRDCGVP